MYIVEKEAEERTDISEDPTHLWRIKEKPYMSVSSLCHPSSGVNPSQSTSPDSQPLFRAVKEECSFSNQSDEEELETPLPLRSEEDWLDYHHNYGHWQPSYSSAPVPWPPRPHPAACLPHSCHPYPHLDWGHSPELVETGSDSGYSVSVNVPHFSLPPAGAVSQVQFGEMESISFAADRSAMLPEECRSVFITYSSDAFTDIVPFADFLSKHGFQPTIDKVDGSVDCTDINSRRDGALKDNSTVIIIAISPKYKADVEGIAKDKQGLHTKYIHSMEHVPAWLHNTKVYHWPRHSQDLLLRLLRRERHAPPPVAKEMGVVIQPMPLWAALPAPQWQYHFDSH
uniref:SEFIR domain-containing protein n=1 Tax=Knipowitschia caucasica TaxID=637954 RepID=A0AAV2JE48_KNICA